MHTKQWRWLKLGLMTAAVVVGLMVTLTPSATAGAYYGDYTLTAKHSGKCLDVAWFSTVDGGDIVQSWCSGAANQTWALHLITNHYFMLVSKHSGKCMDVQNGSLQHAADVIQWSCNGSDSQLWNPIYIKTENGIPYYILENKKSWKCLDVAWFSMSNGGNVLQANCTATDNQLWDLRDLTYGTHGL